MLPTVPFLTLPGDSSFALDPSEAADLPRGGPVGGWALPSSHVGMLIGHQHDALEEAFFFFPNNLFFNVLFLTPKPFCTGE